MVHNTRQPPYSYPPPAAQPEVEHPSTPRTTTSHRAWVDTPYPPRTMFTYPVPPPASRPRPASETFVDPLPPVRVESVPPEDDTETTPRAPSTATFPTPVPPPTPTPARVPRAGATPRIPSLCATPMSETAPAWLNQPHNRARSGTISSTPAGNGTGNGTGTTAQYPPKHANLPPRPSHPPGFTPPPVLKVTPPMPTPMSASKLVGANTAPAPAPAPTPITAMQNSLLKTLLDPPEPPSNPRGHNANANPNRNDANGSNGANPNFEAIWRAMGDDRKWYLNLGASPPNTCKIVVDRKAGTVCARPAHRDTRGMMCYGHLCRLGAEFEGVLDHD